MQSETEQLAPNSSTLEVQKETRSSLSLYEEYSHSNIVDTVRTRRTTYDRATKEERRELERKVEAEVKGFQSWLEQKKSLNPAASHYYAISLKSLLLGLPIGVHLAQLFNILLKNLDNKASSNH